MIINTGGDSRKNRELQLLWINPDAYAEKLKAMASQTLDFNVTGYETLYIVTVLSTDVKFIKTDVVMPGIATQQTVGYNNGTTTYVRTVTITDEKLTIGSAYKMANASPTAVDNKYVIPMYIYGY